MTMPAIRIRGLGKYFGPVVDVDGSERPREAYRTLMRIAGLSVRSDDRDDVKATVAVTDGLVIRLGRKILRVRLG